MAESAAQVTVGVKEAAKIAGVSEKQVRAWIKEGTIRADLVKGRYGEEYRIEASSLPQTTEPVRQGQTNSGQSGQGTAGTLSTGAARLETRVVEALMAMLDDTQKRLEGATTRAAQLEGERDRRLVLESHAEHLQQEADRAKVLEVELRHVRGQRLALLVALILAVAGVGVAVWRLVGR